MIDKFADYLRYELNRSVLTVEAYVRDVRQFREFMAPKPLQDAITADVREWIASLAESEKPRSLRRKAQSLRAYYRFLLRQGLVTLNPAADIILAKTDKALPEFVRADEMEGLMRLLRQESEMADSSEQIASYLIMEILYTTGMRQAELVGLHDHDVDTNTLEIKVTGKRNKQRVIPISRELGEWVARYRSQRDLEYPQEEFPDSPFIILRGKGLTKSQLYRLVKENLAPTNAHKKSPHVLRHTFATAMLSGGAGIESVKELLGHASVGTTQIYTHVSLADLKKNYRAAHPRASKDDND